MGHCNLRFPGSSNSSALASRVAGTAGTCHHTKLISVFLVEIRFHHIDQTGLELLTLWSALLSLPKCWDYRHEPLHLAPYDFLNNFFFFLTYFIVRLQYMIWKIYKLWVYQQFILSVMFPINSRLGVVRFWGSPKLYTDFQLLGGQLLNLCIAQELTVHLKWWLWL